MGTRRLSCEEGPNISQISRVLGMSRTTVRKYLSEDAFPEWSRHSPRPSIFAPYESYLEDRWTEGARSPLGLLRELKERGYTGSKRPVSRWAQERRTEPHLCTPKKYRADCLSEPKTRRRQGRLPAPRRLAWLLIRDPDTLGPDEEQLLKILRRDAAVGSIWTRGSVPAQNPESRGSIPSPQVSDSTTLPCGRFFPNPGATVRPKVRLTGSR